MDGNAATTSSATNRRTVIKSGAGAFAALAGLGAIAIAQAQGTPEAEEGGSLLGAYGVIRSYVVKDDASVDELNALVDDFAGILSAGAGFINYNVIYDEETRGYVAIGIFENAESAQASSEEAAAFIVEHNLGDYYVDTTPVIVQGAITVSA